MQGLYIHIPFCVKKCKYCDFVSITNADDIYDKYINRVIDEMLEYKSKQIDTIFIGGGTPSILPTELIYKLLNGIHKNFSIAKNYEFSFECNPGTLNKEKINEFLTGGANRVSVGVQSFNDAELKQIGRIHNSKTAYDSVLELHNCGFENINIDLMTALPNQTPKSLETTLDIANRLPIKHISAYSLIIEENTPLYYEYKDNRLSIPDEETDRMMYHNSINKLLEYGFEQYEISNFSQKGFECKHNLKYWNCEEYIGIGAAAHSYADNIRYFNSADIKEYILSNKREISKLTQNDKISEFMMLGLRKKSGVSEIEFKKRFGINIEDIFSKELNKFTKLNLLEHKNNNYYLTSYGIDVSNSVMCEFIL